MVCSWHSVAAVASSGFPFGDSSNMSTLLNSSALSVHQRRGLQCVIAILGRELCLVCSWHSVASSRLPFGDSSNISALLNCSILSVHQRRGVQCEPALRSEPPVSIRRQVENKQRGSNGCPCSRGQVPQATPVVRAREGCPGPPPPGAHPHEHIDGSLPFFFALVSWPVVTSEFAAWICAPGLTDHPDTSDAGAHLQSSPL